MVSRLQRRLAAWLALLALLGAGVVAPLAHASAMQPAAGVAADFCSVAGTVPGTGGSMPMAPGDHDASSHDDCARCCASVSPLAAFALVVAPTLPAEPRLAAAPESTPAVHVTVPLQRGSPPRAPPVLRS